jgi:hypothetical protein
MFLRLKIYKFKVPGLKVPTTQSSYCSKFLGLKLPTVAKFLPSKFILVQIFHSCKVPTVSENSPTVVKFLQLNLPTLKVPTVENAFVPKFLRI